MIFIRVKDHGIFKFIDSIGDGNCFFNALVLSSDINIENPDELRSILVKSIKGKAYFKSIYSKLDASNDMPYDKWIINLSIRGTWQDQTTAALLFLLFQINICIISNTLDGFQVVDMRKWLKMVENG